MHKIDKEKCISCGSCVSSCPVEAIVQEGSVYTITDACIDCDACTSTCPVEAISA